MRFDLICPYICVQKSGKKNCQLDGFLTVKMATGRWTYQLSIIWGKLSNCQQVTYSKPWFVYGLSPLSWNIRKYQTLKCTIDPKQMYLTAPKTFWASKIQQKNACLSDVVWDSLLKAESSSEKLRFGAYEDVFLLLHPWVFVELFHTQNQLKSFVSCISSPRVVRPIGLFMGCTYIARVEKLPVVMVMKPKSSGLIYSSLLKDRKGIFKPPPSIYPKANQFKMDVSGHPRPFPK